LRPALVLVTLGAAWAARADGGDPARWRVRGLVETGFGGGRSDGVTVAMFPTTLELGARIWGPLSVDLSATGILTSARYLACGEERRPNAALGALGLRADLANGKSASWVDPFVEVHGGVGGQGGGPELAGACPPPRVFGTGGARAGIDVWLGRVAVTIVLGYDYVPIGQVLAASIGASVVLY
jgi:hypothetical protein